MFKIEKKLMRKVIFIFFLFPFIQILNAQENTASNSDTANIVRKDAPNLFFDCEFCNQSYYRQEIQFVNFVRDRRMADIYLMITVISLGGGGEIYTLYFTGKNKYDGFVDTLRVETIANMSQAEIRAAILSKLKIGLLPYLVKSNLLNSITYSIDMPVEALDASKIKDKWNFWTLNINGGINGDGNSYTKMLGFNYFISANRTTEKLKTETGSFYNQTIQQFKINDSTTINGMQKSLGAYHLLAFSVGKHFAVGQFATFFKGTQINLNHSICYYPTFEYNFFKYEEASRKQLRFIYRVGIRNQDYTEKTIYGKKNEWYGVHSVVIQYNQIEKWGNVNLSLGAWHYFNYPNNYNISVYPAVHFNPIKGLRVGIWGGFKVVNDQFFLRASDATASEILLNQIQLHTDYSYNFGFEIGYTFGSKYNNIINVRFDIDDNYW